MFLYYQFLTSGFLFVRSRSFQIVGFPEIVFFRFCLAREIVNLRYILLTVREFRTFIG